jgi:hypothetical protein
METAVIHTQLLGVGISRKVYDLGDGRVVKHCHPDYCPGLARFCDCMREAKLWHRTRAKILAPVLAYGLHWLIMPKASMTARELHDVREIWEILRHLYTQAASLGIRDNHASNVGLFNGQWKILDYTV